MNIAGVVVYARPNSGEELQTELTTLTGVEIHAVSDEGKMVLTIENQHETDLADTLLEMQKLDGVLSASLVYHHNENNLNVGEPS